MIVFDTKCNATFQVESALVEHPAVAESAVVARPHSVKGECLYCYVTLAEGNDFTEKLIVELRNKGKDLHIHIFVFFQHIVKGIPCENVLECYL